MSRRKKNKREIKSTQKTGSRAKGHARCELALKIVKTDNTFYVGLTMPPVYVGKCIHCNSHLYVTMQGKTDATIEHIYPLSAGGSNEDLKNLALACKGCNNEKGVRHDGKNLDARALEVIQALLAKRASRWKEDVVA